MEANRAAVLAVLIIVGTVFIQCCAAPSNNQQLGAQKMYNAERGAKMIQEISDAEDNLSNTFLTTMDQLYIKVAKELDNQPQQEENARRGVIHAQANEEMDMEEELKQMMLTKMKEMYDRAMNGDINDFVNNQEQPQGYSHGGAGMEELMNYFLSKKNGEIMTSVNSISDLTTITAESEIEAHIMSNGYRYLPIYKFDRANRCYSDWPSSQNDNKCLGPSQPKQSSFLPIRLL